jgi:hypothetical protein
MSKDIREAILPREAAGLTVESTPGHYGVLRDGKPLRKANGMPCPFAAPDEFSDECVRRTRVPHRSPPVGEGDGTPPMFDENAGSGIVGLA